MAEYKKSQSKQQVQIDDMSEAEVKDKLKRLMGGGLGAARVQNELDELQEQDPEEIKDGYQLRFVGKDYARLQAGLATETVIVPNNEHNAKPENKNSQNLFITGDNLDALKHLENSYTGKVDVIYIDPPYNTGSDGFVYSDNFSFSDEDLQLKLGLTKDEVKRLRSLEGKSSHSAWLTFMYPRLLIAKRLLKDTGVIFISIDDNEQANLKVMCDEIFVESNFVSNFIWESKYTLSNDAKWVSDQHENVLFYAKNKLKFEIGRLDRTAEQNKSYTNPDNDPKGPWKATPIHAKSGTDKSRYEVTFPNGVIWKSPQGRFPRYNQKRLMELYSLGELYFNKNGGVDKKTYLSDVESKGVVAGSMLHHSKVGHTHSNNEELAALVGKGMFDNPKGTRLIEHLLQIANAKNIKNAVVLDFFSGSGTTGHAVMSLNTDSGKRQHIQIQWPELVRQGSDADLAGYKTIDEIARKRLELAADKIRETKGDDLPPGWDGGYRHFTLAHASDATLDKLEDFDPNAVFADDMVTPFAAKSLDAVAASDDKPSIPVDGTASGTETLLATWLCDDGFGLTPDIQTLDFADAKAHLVDSSLYIIDKAWSTASTKALLNAVGTNKLSLSTIILYPYSFGFTTLRELKDSLRTNLDTDHTISIVERF